MITSEFAGPECHVNSIAAQPGSLVPVPNVADDFVGGKGVGGEVVVPAMHNGGTTSER
jgi:hypothetical protein